MKRWFFLWSIALVSIGMSGCLIFNEAICSESMDACAPVNRQYSGTYEFIVTDKETGQPIPDVYFHTVVEIYFGYIWNNDCCIRNEISLDNKMGNADANGLYSRIYYVKEVKEGEYTNMWITVSKQGYEPYKIKKRLAPGTSTVEIKLLKFSDQP